MTTSKKAILIDNLYYLLDTTHINDRGERHIIYCGGKNVQCINISFYTHQKIAELETVTYDTCCKHGGQLKRGTGTVAVTLCALNYVLNNYHNIKSFRLDDFSNRVCNYGTSDLSNISFFHFSLAFHNSTFYEGVFGARIGTPAKYNEYTNFKRHVMSSETRSKLLGKRYFQDGDYRLTLFNSSNTLREFFDRLKVDSNGNRINIDNLCNMALTNDEWLVRMINDAALPYNVNNYRNDWHISCDTVTRLSLSEEYILNWSDTVDTDMNENAKKATELKDFTLINQFSKQADKCLVDSDIEYQKGGMGKQRLGVYVRTIDNNGIESDTFLGEPHNYIENRNKLLSGDPGMTYGLIVYKPILE